MVAVDNVYIKEGGEEKGREFCGDLGSLVRKHRDVHLNCKGGKKDN